MEKVFEWSIISTENKVYIQTERKPNEYTKIERRVRQSCIFSLDWFNLHNEIILKGQENQPGVILNKHDLENIHYTSVNK